MYLYWRATANRRAVRRALRERVKKHHWSNCREPPENAEGGSPPAASLIGCFTTRTRLIVES